MPNKNTAWVVHILVWNTDTQVGQINDQGNITLRGVGDGIEFTPASGLTQIDSTYLKGIYKLPISALENNYDMATVGGISTTTDVIILPITWMNEPEDFSATKKVSLNAATPASVGTVTGNVNGTVATVTNLTNAPTVGDFTAAMKSSITAAVPTSGQIADAVWDEIVGTHTGVGSTGAALSVAGSSGDPWATVIPGPYGDNTAGKVIGTNLNAPVNAASLSTTSITAVVDAIKAMVIDGTITFQKATTLRLAKDAGQVVVDGNTFKYYDQSGNLILTDPITTEGSTRVVV